MSINSLAPELLHQILSNLDLQNLSNASFVCHTWLSPCRELYWSRTSLVLNNWMPAKLPPLLREKTTIPRHVGTIVVDESELGDDDDDEEKQNLDWQESLLTVLSHFDTVSTMVIRYLDLTKYSEQARQQMLRPGLAISTLVIQNLKATQPSDVVPFVMESSGMKFLGLGSCSFSNEEINIVANRSPSKQNIKLNRLSHFVIFGREEGTWTELMPCIMEQPSLENLKTIVIVCHDNEAVSRLLKTAAPSLRSLALGFNEDTNFNLNHIKLLRTLSIDISPYPCQITLLSNLVQTVSSVSGLEHLFINTGPDMLKPDKQFDSAVPLWEALDFHLSRLPGLQYVAFTMVIESCMTMFMRTKGALGGIFDKWKGDLLQFAEAKLPTCREKDLIQVRQLAGEWTSEAFSDANIVV